MRVRPQPAAAVRTASALPEPTRFGEPVWLQPYPDHLLEDLLDALPDRQPGPEARYELRESVSLTFVTALQHGRAVLREHRAEPGHRPAAAAGSARERELAGLFATALEAGDTDAVIALLAEDSWLTMPPEPQQHHGRESIRVFLADREQARGVPLRAVPVRANGQHALGCYLPTPLAAIARPYGLVVLTADRDAITAITWFRDTSVYPAFGLPRSLPHPLPRPLPGGPHRTE
ncbi:MULTISPECIES: hypothetical protein [unclassified Streptomyces]|uniref:hypothetical protein n=1 Tax=unclassified Streptomyces TaxID=2593676 RepID=UPI0012FF02FB|nr:MULTISPECIES: hypothetical protein [unclassified Streptomyces]